MFHNSSYLDLKKKPVKMWWTQPLSGHQTWMFGIDFCSPYLVSNYFISIALAIVIS